MYHDGNNEKATTAAIQAAQNDGDVFLFVGVV